MKSADYQVFYSPIFNPVSKNWVSIEGCGSSSKTTTPTNIKKHQGMVQEEMLDHSWVASKDSDLNHIQKLW
jgi:hypothetical protein